jgi:hypothetical protein
MLLLSPVGAQQPCPSIAAVVTNPYSVRKICLYAEDPADPSVDAPESSQHPIRAPREERPASPSHISGFDISESISAGSSAIETFHKPMVDTIIRTQAIQILGSLERLSDISNEFFTGTYQRIPVMSRNRFHSNLQSLTAEPRADFILLCLCIHLVQQTPVEATTTMQSPLYVTLKNLVSFIEATKEPSLDGLHCRILLIFYEIGHGLDMAAYISVAVCTRIARALGYHNKPWRRTNAGVEKLAMEEKKRTWWTILNMDRIISLSIGDALLGTDDPQSSDPLPIEDSLWTHDSFPEDFQEPILATPSDIRVGQMARECQVANLVGRVARHVFEPVSLESDFYAEEAVQLERTLIAFIPLLAQEELKIGNYCGALGICTR